MNDTFYDHIPEDQAQQLIQSAAIISGKPAAEMTIQDAAQILEERGIKMPTYNPNIDKAAAMLWHTMDTKQLKRILSADTGNLETAFSSVIDELAQKAQEAIPAQDAQEIKTFDAKIWEEAGGNYEEIRRALNDRLQAATEPAREILTGTVSEISKAAREAFASITEIVNSEAYKAIRQKLQEVGQIIEKYRLNYKELAEASEALEQLIPFIQMELDAAQDNPAFTGCTLEDVLQHGLDDDLRPTDSKYRPIIEKAKQRLAEYKAAQEALAEIDKYYLTIAHGKPTDALAFLSSKNAEIDTYTGNATIIAKKNDVKVVLQKFNKLNASLSINTDKLLSTAIGLFTKQNDFRHNNEPKRTVSFNLKGYAYLLGYDVEEHETATPEEAEKERRRAKNQLDNARKSIKKDLSILNALQLTWEEKIKGKANDFLNVSLTTTTGIVNGEIIISFSPEIASYLTERNLLTPYPTKLLRIDGRQANAYYIGRKLIEYYNIYNNQLRDTNDIISVPALLSVTDLPSYEEVQKKDRGHWQERIKEPFENALDTLTRFGILDDWQYTHAKKEKLDDAEAQNIIRYEDFTALYVNFTPADIIDNTERLQVMKEEREAEKKKKDNKKSKK